MAEGYLRARYGDRFEAISAGTVASTVSPLAVRVMAEIGVDISGHRSKDIGEFLGEEVDVVVTVCDAAQAVCPMFPGAKQTIHTSFPDPGAATGTEEERLAVFRAVRDRMTTWIDGTFGGSAHDRAAVEPQDPAALELPARRGALPPRQRLSPVAVVIVLNADEDKIPPELEAMVRAGVESGAVLSGTVQTPNIGFEKMIRNIVGNPDIRYLVLANPESAGHATGAALKALIANGLDEKARIIGSDAPFPVVDTVPREVVERFLDQVTLVDCQFQDIPTLREAFCACYQEAPTE